MYTPIEAFTSHSWLPLCILSEKALYFQKYVLHWKQICRSPNDSMELIFLSKWKWVFKGIMLNVAGVKQRIDTFVPTRNWIWWPCVFAGVMCWLCLYCKMSWFFFFFFKQWPVEKGLIKENRLMLEFLSGVLETVGTRKGTPGKAMTN